MNDLISRQAAISAICNACGKIDCDKMDKCEKLQLPPANCSEFPNNCEHITEDGVTCAKYPACDDCLDNPLNKVKGSERLLKGKTEPTISKMEQVEEPMKTTDYCDICKRDMCEDCVADATNPYCVPSLYEINYEPKDEPQTDDLQDWKDRMWAEAVKEEPQTGEMMTEEEFDSMLARALVGQTDCGWK